MPPTDFCGNGRFFSVQCSVYSEQWDDLLRTVYWNSAIFKRSNEQRLLYLCLRVGHIRLSRNGGDEKHQIRDWRRDQSSISNLF